MSALSGNKRCEYFFPEEENYGKGDESRLRMEIRDESKTVELWLTREERDDLAFRESLKPMYQKYKEQKYLVQFPKAVVRLANGRTLTVTANNPRRNTYIASVTLDGRRYLPGSHRRCARPAQHFPGGFFAASPALPSAGR